MVSQSPSPVIRGFARIHQNTGRGSCWKTEWCGTYVWWCGTYHHTYVPPYHNCSSSTATSLFSAKTRWTGAQRAIFAWFAVVKTFFCFSVIGEYYHRLPLVLRTLCMLWALLGELTLVLGGDDRPIGS